MSLRLTVKEAFERNLENVAPPQVDLEAVRGAARRSRSRRLRLGALGLVVAIAAIAGIATLDPEPTPAPVDPGLPAMDFNAGLRAFSDNGRTYLGGQSFRTDAVRDLDGSATPTPYGLMFFSEEQAARLLRADGRVQTLAPAPPKPVAFDQTAVFDAYVPMMAWTRRGAGGVEVVMYRFDANPGLYDTYPVPCAGAECDSIRLAAFDIGKLFLTSDRGTRVLDPSMGPDASWLRVTRGRVLDVRNKVIIATDLPAGPNPPDAPPDLAIPASAQLPGWRMIPAAGAHSRLTAEGGWQTDGSTTLVPTHPDVPALVMQVPAGDGETESRLDSDARSLLVSRADPDGDRFWDCDLTAACTEIGFVPGGERPVLLGRG